MNRYGIYYPKNTLRDWDNLKGIKKVRDEIMERKAIAEEIVINRIHRYGTIGGVRL